MDHATCIVKLRVSKIEKKLVVKIRYGCIMYIEVGRLKILNQDVLLLLIRNLVSKGLMLNQN